MSEVHRSVMGPTSCQRLKEDAGPCMRPRHLSAQLSLTRLLQHAGDCSRPVSCAAVSGSPAIRPKLLSPPRQLLPSTHAALWAGRCQMPPSHRAWHARR